MRPSNKSRFSHSRPVGLRVVLSVGLAVAGLGSVTPAARAQTGTLSTLYSFTGGADGAGAVGGVVADAAGTLYGETDQGGSTACTSHYQPPRYGCGTVYAFNQATGLKVLATFTGANGAHGNTTLTLVGSTLYGLTEYGGTRNYGVLYSVTPGGTFSVVHNFLGGKDGRDPGSLLISPKGVLVGSTVEGGPPNAECGSVVCGTIFVYAPRTGSFRPVYEFDFTEWHGWRDRCLGSRSNRLRRGLFRAVSSHF